LYSGVIWEQLTKTSLGQEREISKNMADKIA